MPSFGALVRRAVADAPPEQAASLSGVLSTIHQLAIALVGIAPAGTLFLSYPAPTPDNLAPVLIALTATVTLFGVAVTVALNRAQASRCGDRAPASVDGLPQR